MQRCNAALQCRRFHQTMKVECADNEDNNGGDDDDNKDGV